MRKAWPVSLPPRLTRVTGAATDAWEDVCAIAGYLLLDVVDELPAVKQRTRRHHELVLQAFEQGRTYERERMGVSAAAGAGSRPSTASPRHRHLHLV